MAENVCRIYPTLDRSLLLGGAVLHDIAKIDEFEVSSTGMATGYSVEGTLVGHLVKGAMIVRETAKEVGIKEDTAVLLEHMLISHHGTPEFGAAKMPMFIEAELLSQLDLLDARLYEMNHAVSEVEVGAFTPRQWALENRNLYNHGRNRGEGINLIEE